MILQAACLGYHQVPGLFLSFLSEGVAKNLKRFYFFRSKRSFVLFFDTFSSPGIYQISTLDLKALHEFSYTYYIRIGCYIQ